MKNFASYKSVFRKFFYVDLYPIQPVMQRLLIADTALVLAVVWYTIPVLNSSCKETTQQSFKKILNLLSKTFGNSQNTLHGLLVIFRIMFEFFEIKLKNAWTEISQKDRSRKDE